ncbi:MAG: hypothetical protein GX682_04190 [Clostridiaceae bacterium]|nr:hypothetical protein [Clostridiaceae bacterium]
MENREKYLKAMKILKKDLKIEDLKVLIKIDYENKKITQELYNEAMQSVDTEQEVKTLKDRIKVDVNLSKSDKKVEIENKNINLINKKDKTKKNEYVKAVKTMCNYASKDKIRNFIIRDFKNGRTTEETYEEAIKLLDEEQER